jgi:hypothetical protein
LIHRRAAVLHPLVVVRQEFNNAAVAHARPIPPQHSAVHTRSSTHRKQREDAAVLYVHTDLDAANRCGTTNAQRGTIVSERGATLSPTVKGDARRDCDEYA